MFYFKFYDAPELDGYSAAMKNKIINVAVKLSRKEYPINITKRLLSLLSFVVLPTFVIYSFFYFGAAIAFCALATMVINIKLNSVESQIIKPFLLQAISVIENKNNN